MTPRSRIVLAVVVTPVAVAAGLAIFGCERLGLAPRPLTAGVAIEPAGTGLAVAGPVELEAGSAFTLHAFIEAEDRRGRKLYYTEASRLAIGGREVPPEALASPERFRDARILWFTVEGSRPFLEVDDAADLSEFRFQEVLRPDWPRLWSIPGSVEPSYAASEVFRSGEQRADFGSQRYQVRFEVFGPESDITPRLRIKSPGADELPARSSEFPTAAVRLPAPLDLPSRMFGLSQIEPGSGAPPEVRATLADWTARGLAFHRLGVVKLLLDRAGVGLGDLDWRRVPLDGTTAWGAPGDLLRAGERLVYLFRDSGTRGRLDLDDLCLDFEKGARIQVLGRIFTGEGLVERGSWPAAAVAETGAMKESR